VKLTVVRSFLCTSAFVSAVAVQNVAIQDLSDPHRGSAGWSSSGRARSASGWCDCQSYAAWSGAELSGILLRLTPVGRLEVKAINDATGSPIDAIRIRLERDGAPDRYASSSKMGNWWLVPTAPIRLRVEADGFQPAWYGGDGPEAHSAPLLLAPRQILSVTVSLRPLAE
jgi:hypothetical protein